MVQGPAHSNHFVLPVEFAQVEENPPLWVLRLEVVTLLTLLLELSNGVDVGILQLFQLLLAGGWDPVSEDPFCQQGIEKT